MKAEYSYDAWGKCTIKSNVSGIATINPFRYRGYYYDEEISLYYLNSRYYDPEIGRFISADSIDYLAPATINGLNVYAYCLNNPVMGYDPNGTFGIIATLLVAAIVGAMVGVAGTLVGDVVNYVVTDEWEWSSWETYVGSVIGGAIGGMLSLIPGAGTFIGGIASGIIGTFSGLAIGKATGSNDMSWLDIVGTTLFVAGISLVTAGMSKYLSIPGITVGSHSWQQVFKSGFTKMLRYGFNMSAKTLAKGAGYLLVSGFTTGFFVGNILQVLLLDRG